ncbi:unnamed protein product [Larinioides sclopetarius]|uniref:Uncharacterized protein n=1 Tax=Larinioides sclopetarius TaxID=280406 RepID=A0AAV1YP74_9ARAC
MCLGSLFSSRKWVVIQKLWKNPAGQRDLENQNGKQKTFNPKHSCFLFCSLLSYVPFIWPSGHMHDRHLSTMTQYTYPYIQFQYPDSVNYWC